VTRCCAWCKQDLATGLQVTNQDQPITHGICVPCSARVTQPSRFTQDYQDRFIAGQADDNETIAAMSDLIRTKEHHRARGYYRRLAQTLIDAGYIDDQGNVL
jgi:hypothetical protein